MHGLPGPRETQGRNQQPPPASCARHQLPEQVAHACDRFPESEEARLPWGTAAALSVLLLVVVVVAVVAAVVAKVIQHRYAFRFKVM